MLVNCYYCGFGAVHSIEFYSKESLIWKSDIVNQRLSEDVTRTYNYENVAFYLLAAYIRKFYNRYPDTKKINLFTSVDLLTINQMIKSPKNDAEKYLSNLYNEKKITFDHRGDAVVFKKAKDVSYAYFKLKNEGKEVKFNHSEDPFADCFSDRYNIY